MNELDDDCAIADLAITTLTLSNRRFDKRLLRLETSGVFELLLLRPGRVPLRSAARNVILVRNLMERPRPSRKRLRDFLSFFCFEVD